MKKEIIVTKEVNIKYLECFIGGRYWEDLKFNNNESNADTDDDNDALFESLQSKMPNFFILDTENYCNYRDTSRQCLHLKIDLDSGKVLNWPIGNTLECYIKSVDENGFILYDDNWDVIKELRQSYVIGGSSINEYGDYFVANINKDGIIENWNADYEVRHILEDMELCHDDY